MTAVIFSVPNMWLWKGNRLLWSHLWRCWLLWKHSLSDGHFGILKREIKERSQMNRTWFKTIITREPHFINRHLCKASYVKLYRKQKTQIEVKWTDIFSCVHSQRTDNDDTGNAPGHHCQTTLAHVGSLKLRKWHVPITASAAPHCPDVHSDWQHFLLCCMERCGEQHGHCLLSCIYSAARPENTREMCSLGGQGEGESEQGWQSFGNLKLQLKACPADWEVVTFFLH